MPTTTATELAQLGGLVTTDSSTSTVTVNGTLAATTITLPNNSVTAVKLANPQYTGFRNRITNGDMRIDQRNNGSSVNVSGFYPVDRFLVGNAVTTWTAQRSTVAPSGFTNSFLYTSVTGGAAGVNDRLIIRHRIEGTSFSDLAWGSASASAVTLSFWVRSSLTGTHSGSLRNALEDRAYPFSYSISSANTWEYKTVTISGDTTGTWETGIGIGVQLSFDLGSGTSKRGTAGAWSAGDLVGVTGAVSVSNTTGATFYITGVQLEAGATATDFERRPYGTELALCQRYFTQLSSATVIPGIQNGTTSIDAYVTTPVALRATPSVTLGAGNSYCSRQTTAAMSTSTTLTNILLFGTNVFKFNIAGFTGLNDLYSCVLYTGNILQISAEL